MIVCLPDVLDLTELREIRTALAASSFVDGKTTAGYRAKRVKNNLQLDKESAEATQVKSLVLNGLKRNPQFRRTVLPRLIQTPMISRYRAGMNYGRHVDDALMGGQRKTRTDVSVTVFLSDPGDYDGGELLIQSPYGDQEVKLPAGAAVLYPSSTLHQVLPVTRGERLAGVTWVESLVRDPARREVLHDLDRISEHLGRQDPDSEESDLAAKTYSNLLRMWSDT